MNCRCACRGDFEIATCNRAAEALQPEQPQQAADAWAAKPFLEHVPRIFTALQQARDSVKAAANGFHGQLRIALSDGITPSRMPTLLALCRQEEPEVELRLFEVTVSQQIHGCMTICMA